MDRGSRQSSKGRVSRERYNFDERKKCGRKSNGNKRRRDVAKNTKSIGANLDVAKQNVILTYGQCLTPSEFIDSSDFLPVFKHHQKFRGSLRASAGIRILRIVSVKQERRPGKRDGAFELGSCNSEAFVCGLLLLHCNFRYFCL